MAQNIYDNREFYTAYLKLKRSQEGLDGAPEWPILRDMVQDVNLLNVLDLGCGYGWFCRWASKNGAANVHGIDVSQNMLTRASEFESDLLITYENADLEKIDLKESAYQLVYSSLTFHYIKNLDQVFANIQKSLSYSGRLVFSVEHPIYTAPSSPFWQKGTDGREIWPLNSYSNEGLRETNWFIDGVQKYHRTIETYISLLHKNGFTLVNLVEWVPSKKDLEGNPEWAIEKERPAFLLISAKVTN